METSQNFRSGFVALVGLPNSGKSSLLNALVGEKVAIVSSKPQTTRRRIQGLVNTESAQLIFVDAPGVIDAASTDLNRFILQEYQDVLSEADVAMAILPMDETNRESIEKIVTLVRDSKKPYLIVVTKSDIPSPQERDDWLRSLHEILKSTVPNAEAVDVLTTSALTDATGTRLGVLNKVQGLLPESPALYDSEIFTTETLRDLVAEIVREKCFQFLHQEIPFSLAVKIQSFHEDQSITRIEADILVERESHKKIVIGGGGSLIKKIGMEARKDIEKIVGTKVFLGLHVACKPRWMQDPHLLKELGYVRRD